MDFNLADRVSGSGPTAIVVSSMMIRQAILRKDEIDRGGRDSITQADFACLKEIFDD